VRWQAGGVSYGRLGAMFEGFRRFLAEQPRREVSDGLCKT
jgi:hypothetical protein